MTELAIGLVALFCALLYVYERYARERAEERWALERQDLMNRIQAPEQVARNVALREKMYGQPGWRPAPRRPQEPDGDEEDESSDTASLTSGDYEDMVEVESTAQAGRTRWLGES